jgi:phospholipid-binding domain protein
MKKILPLLVISPFLSACAPLLLGGAATTATVAHDRRSTGTIIDDNTLEVKVHATIADNKLLADNSNVSVTGYNGTILLTGEAYDDNIRQQITAAAKSVHGVKRVENQLVVGRRSTFMERTYDSKQTAKVKAALLDIKLPGFDPTRVKVVTEHGYTYLLGIVSQEEAEAAASVASRVSGVKGVVTMFEISGNPSASNLTGTF